MKNSLALFFGATFTLTLSTFTLLGCAICTAILKAEGRTQEVQQYLALVFWSITTASASLTMVIALILSELRATKEKK